MEKICSSEMSGSLQTMQHHNPQDHILFTVIAMTSNPVNIIVLYIVISRVHRNFRKLKAAKYVGSS
jgi:hypothetical protein